MSFWSMPELSHRQAAPGRLVVRRAKWGTIR
jgi:hypothetical protein